jgi:cardiolipin synthase
MNSWSRWDRRTSTLTPYELNDEASLNVYDGPFARKMTEVFEADLRRSVPYSLENWRKRSLLQRAAEMVLLPIRAQL